jgi:Flp pilus assembly protein TadD
MKHNFHDVSKRCQTLFLLLLIGMLAGCADMPTEGQPYSEFTTLGDDDAKLTYSTAFPIASAQEAILRGDSAMARGDLDRALFEYIRALEKAGADGETLYKIGRIHLSRNDPQRARLALRLCLKKDPDHIGALVEMAKLEMHQREYVTAKKVLEHAFDLAPYSAEIFNALGVIDDIQKNHYQAQIYYLQALNLDRNNPIYMNNLGYSYYLMGLQDRAEQMFLDTLKIDPSHHLAWRNLGLIYAKTGQYRLALEAFGKTEKEFQAYNDVGYVAMLSGRFDDAQHYFSEAMRLSPTYYELAVNNAKHLAILREK